MKVVQTIETDVPTFRFTERGSNLGNPLLNNIYIDYNMQKEYLIQFKNNINTLFCNLSFASQYKMSPDCQWTVDDRPTQNKNVPMSGAVHIF